MADHTPYQKKIIKRYYDNFDGIQEQRLSELATELYLAEGEETRSALEAGAGQPDPPEIPRGRIEHLLLKRDPSLLVGIIKELQAKG